MRAWRTIKRIADRIWGNPIRLLGIVVAVIAIVNYRTLMENLPTSIPELTTWWAERDPLELTVRGEMTGEPVCWQMRLTFLDAAGQPILAEKDYVLRIGSSRPEQQITLPALGHYAVRVSVEVTNGEFDNRCIPVGGIAIMRAKALEARINDVAGKATMTIACDAGGETLQCNVEVG